MTDAAGRSDASRLRSALRPTHPEIDDLYTDEYLSAVLSVPGRTYEYARDEKVRGALEWRRSYGVDGLLAAFRYDEAGGTLRPTGDGEDASGGSRPAPFVPSRELIDVSRSAAFRFAGFDDRGRGILHSNAGRIDWWETGVEDGIRYHVLVIESALRLLSTRNASPVAGSDEERRSESLVLCVDASELPYLPPPPRTFTEMAGLMQRAYPDRIHRIYIGPVNPLLQMLHDTISPFLRPRSREKIVLLDSAPSLESVARSQV